MTIQELYNHVAQLGFETSLEDDDRFILAANRAIKQVGRIRPSTAIIEVAHFPLPNIVATDTKTPQKVGVCFSASGAMSYYFEANGNGSAVIEKLNADGTYTILKTIVLSTTGSQFAAYRGFVKEGTENYLGEVRIRFTGTYLYYIKNVAFYAQLLGALESDIPAYEEYTSYDLTSLTNDFASFVCPPIVDVREQLFVLGKDYFVENSTKLLLPTSISGVFHIKYERNRNTITSDNMSANIDLDEELSALLPLLIAAYVWADDEPTKAQYYLNLYREQEQAIRMSDKSLVGVRVRNVTGW